MNQENRINQEVDEEITIDLMALCRVVWKKLPIIILVGIITAGLALVGTKFLLTPQYTSVTKAYILSKQDNANGMTMSDLQVSSTLTKDYVELAKSRPVLENTIKKLELDMAPSTLSSKITVDVPQDTRILRIAVEDENPERAKNIADAVREYVGDQIEGIMDVEAVNTVEEGNLPVAPSSPNVMKNTVLGGMLGVILTIGVLVLIYLLDDTIKNQEEVEKYLGLTVLTNVPLKKGERKPGKGKGRKR